jgi:hypothetical protein
VEIIFLSLRIENGVLGENRKKTAYRQGGKRHTGKEENGIPARKSRIKRHKCKKKGNTHYCAGRDSNFAPPR